MSNEEEEVLQFNIRELDPDIIAPNTGRMYNKDYGGNKIALIGRPGCFKAGTEVLMYNGILKNVEDIVLGDIVMGDDSKPRTVLNLCHGYEQMYEVTLGNGEPVVVNENHYLLLKHIDSGEIIEITVNNFLRQTDKFRDEYLWYRSEGVEFKENFIGNNPYVEGYNSTDHVSPFYKLNSRNVRLNILAGIIDRYEPDGYGYVRLQFNSTTLCKDVVFIARSLGLVVHKSYEDNKCYISGDIHHIPCEIRKLQPVNHEKLTTTFELRPCGKGQYFGFTLDGNHRFLLGDFSVVRNSGKSSCITSLLYAKKHIFPVGLVMSGTEGTTGYFKRIFPSLFVYNEYNEEALERFVKRQKIAKEHLENPWAVLLIDDCTDNKKVFNTELQQNLYKMGRHYKMLYLLSMQSPTDLPSSIRTSIDGVFIFREPLHSARKTLWENYASIIPKIYFNQLLDQITDDYTALFVLNNTTENEWQNCCYWYKAPKIPSNWKFGTKEYKEYHNERYNENYTEGF